MAISEKSRPSVLLPAAQLLLLLVAVVSTCASGAHAQYFSITNTCNQTITVSTGSSSAGNNTVSVGAGAVQNITGTVGSFFADNVIITIFPGVSNNIMSITIPVPSAIVAALDRLLNVTRIVISCNGSNCVTLTVTFAFLGRPVTTPLAPICAPTGTGTGARKLLLSVPLPPLPDSLPLPPLPSLPLPPTPSLPLPPLPSLPLPPLPSVPLPPLPSLQLPPLPSVSSYPTAAIAFLATTAVAFHS